MTNKLTEKERLRIVTRHRASIERNGYQPSALFWSSREVQVLRFKQLLMILQSKALFINVKKCQNDVFLQEKIKVKSLSLKILDVGCGFGDLKFFLADICPALDYIGIDVSPDMVQAGGFQYPGIDIRQGELGDFSFADHSFDWVLLSGALNEAVDATGEYAFAKIKEMYRIARYGVAFNLLNRQCEKIGKRPDLQSFVPEEVVVFCRTFASEVCLNQAYLPEDFTVYLWKE